MQPQRTRHASLDFPRANKRLSPQDEWCEFLSTSMAALTADEDEDVGSRSLSSLNGLEMLGHGHSFEPSRSMAPPVPELSKKPQRRESFSESLTSSTGSSPAGAVWRPLGRRASANIVLGASNQLELPAEFGYDLPPRAQLNGMTKKPAARSSSFREGPPLSSSGSSSLVESSSSDEEAEPLDNNAMEREAAMRAGRLDVASPLPVLSEDLGNRPLLVKSPVLSSRKDASTWQLQDEERVTSPRFGAFRGPLGETSASMFGGGMGLFTEESTVNQGHEVRETRQRLTKDMRASSMDFTYASPAEFNPPLPPQEPQLQRIRARSFSYSAGFATNAYPSANAAYPSKPYGPPHPPQADFPVTMRQFHAGGPVPPPPPSASLMHTAPGVRPPRVSIPQVDMHAYHQHSNAPPAAYRRYSTEFLPYAEHEPVDLAAARSQPPAQPQAGTSGRGVRSYSMEYLQSNPRMRTHSLEGNLMFASAAPPVEYPVAGRHGATVAYEWPRSPVAPPLPPDARAMGNQVPYPPPPPEAYYEVEFKRGRSEFFAGNHGFQPRAFVKVEADRGEDIGRVVRRVTDLSKLCSADAASPSEDRPKRHELPTKKILSVATARECELLNDQRQEEHDVYEVCKSKVRQRLLPMNVIDAEYQFDRHKLTFFFEADRRIDFRELVRDLFAIYKTRIWLQQVVPNGKKAGQEVELH